MFSAHITTTITGHCILIIHSVSMTYDSQKSHDCKPYSNYLCVFREVVVAVPWRDDPKAEESPTESELCPGLQSTAEC